MENKHRKTSLEYIEEREEYVVTWCDGSQGIYDYLDSAIQAIKKDFWDNVEMNKEENLDKNERIVKEFIKTALNDDVSLYESYIGNLEIDGQLSDGEFENSLCNFDGAIKMFKKYTDGKEAPKEIHDKWREARRHLEFGGEFCYSLMVTDKLKAALRITLNKYNEEDN